MLSRPGEVVRRHDPDRFLTALFAPPYRREALFTLFAFNHELARAREAASEPMMALIRLQWWREVVEGARQRHEVAEPLTEAIEAGRLARADLLGMIEGREAEAGPIETLAEWRAYVRATAGGVAVAAGRALGAPDDVLPGLCDLGAAYGAGGILRSVPLLARAGRCVLPEDVLAAHDVTADSILTAPHSPALTAALRQLAGEGEAMLLAGSKTLVPRDAIAAVLPAVLARRDLRRVGALGPPRSLADRLAVVRAALLGRI